MSNIFDLQASISLNSSAFMSGIADAQSAFTGLGSTMSAGAVAVGNVVGGLVTSAASSLKDFAGDAVDTYRSYESGMSQIAATLGYSVEDLQDPLSEASQNMAMLSAKAEEMGRTTSFTAADAAEGLNILAMAGYDAQTSVEMIGTVLDLAKAGSLGLGDAASYVAGSMKGFTNEAGNYSDAMEASATYADLMAKGATVANTSVSELGEALSGSAAVVNSFGQTSEEAAVALLRLGEQNVTGAAAATALSAVMKDLYSGTDQAKAALDSLGVSAYDSSGEARNLNDVVNDLDAALSTLTTQERADLENVIFGIQGKRAFDQMVATSGDKLDSFYAAIGDASGSAAQQAETMADNIDGASDSMQSALEGLEIAVMKNLAEPIQNAKETAADALNAMTAGFETGGLMGALESLGQFASDTFANMWEGLELPPEVDAVIGFLGDLVAAVEPLKSVFTDALSEAMSGIASAAGEFIDAFTGKDTGAIATVAGAAGAFVGAFANASAEIIGAIASAAADFMGAFKDAGAGDALAGAASAVSDYLSSFLIVSADIVTEIADGVSEFMEGFKNSGAVEVIAGVAKGAIDLFSSFVITSGDIISSIAGGIKRFLDAFDSEEVGGIIGDIAEHAGKLIDVIMGASSKVIEDIGAAIKTFIDGFDMDSAAGIITDIAKAAGDLFGLFSDALSSVIERISSNFDGFGESIANLWNQAGPSLEKTREALSVFLENVTQIASGIISVLSPVVGFIVDVFAAGIRIGIENAIEVFGALWNTVMDVVDVLQNVLGAAVDVVQGDFDGAKEHITEAWDGLKEFFSDLAEFIKTPFENLGKAFSEIGGIMVENLKRAWDGISSWFENIGSNIVEGIKSGISKAWNGLTSTVTNLASNLVGAVTDFFKIGSPSKVFAEIGDYLVQGLEVGWSREFGNLEDTVYHDMDRLTKTARVGFNDSAIGRSSAAGISSMMAASDFVNRDGVVSINLVLDGDVAATALYDPMRQVAFQRDRVLEAVNA